MQNLYNTHFSNIYIEHEAKKYPDTELLLKRFQKAERIYINDYKSIFNRSRQNFQFQKKSMKLILAVKKDNFIYSGSDQAPNFGHEHFYYNALILNCVYNCDYCYLQGMYPSANIVCFVNSQDFFESVEVELKKHPVYLCISYDTDLLAFENIIPHCRRWVEFTQRHKNLTIEIRTKSANYKAIQDINPSKGVILAWSISPEIIAEKYEKGAVPLKSRLESLSQAILDGWKVRLCFDPVLKINNWEKIYAEFFETVFSCISAEKIFDISAGSFRMNKDYMQTIQKARNDSDILFENFSTDGKTIFYENASEIDTFCKNEIFKYAAKEKVML